MMPRKSIEEGLNITVSTDLNMEAATRLKARAQQERRSKAFIIREAIEMYLATSIVTIEVK